MSASNKPRPEPLGNVSKLFNAAAAISCLASSGYLAAETPIKAPEFRLQYSNYQDWQEGKKERMTVNTPTAWIKSAVSEKDEIEGTFVLDTMSGASVLYHDALTGASGKDIADDRHAFDIANTHYFDELALTTGINYSNEDDYLSRGFNLSTRYWTPDKLTTFATGVGVNYNEVTSSNDDELIGHNQAVHYLLGVTQIIDKVSLVQSNLTFEHRHGYLNDAYKVSDNRPANRDSTAWLTRYVRYIDWAQASLHADYRLYVDSWGINSNTFELSWYQPLGEQDKWMLKPRVRYYTQNAASFYNDLFPDPIEDNLYSADARLSAFADVTTGLKLTREFDGDFSMSVGFDLCYTSNSLRSFGKGSPGLSDLYSRVYSFGIMKKFK